MLRNLPGHPLNPGLLSVTNALIADGIRHDR